MKNLKKILITVAALAALALGGAALAGATPVGGDDENEQALAGATYDSASKAALAETGGGKVTGSEEDDEKGATYEVEVTKTDGSQVDVRLDDQFKVIAVDPDHEHEGEEKGDH